MSVELRMIVWLMTVRLMLVTRDRGLPRSRLGRRRFKGLGLPRLEPLVRGQLLNLLIHLGGQGHGGPRGQRRARQALARL